MLRDLNKTVTITASSVNEEGKIMVRYYASISTSGEGRNDSANVIDRALYKANISQCRLDREAFFEEVDSLEERLILDPIAADKDNAEE